MRKERKLIIVRQKYTPFGGGEIFLQQAIGAIEQLGINVNILCREWDDGETKNIIKMPIKNRFRKSRDKSFHHKACSYIKKQKNCIVQSHERVSCCDIYRAGEGTHKEWLSQRNRKRGFISKLLLKLSPYHRYTLYSERKLFQSKRLKKVICNSNMVKNEIKDHFHLSDDKLEVI